MSDSLFVACILFAVLIITMIVFLVLCIKEASKKIERLEAASNAEPEVGPDTDELTMRLRMTEDFAGFGDAIEYLGVEMLVVSHHYLENPNYNPPQWVPAINVEWMDKTHRVRKISIRDWELPLCKVLRRSGIGGVYFGRDF